MSDVEFKNRTDVKWAGTFDSYFVLSNVSTDSGADMTVGATEVLAGKSKAQSMKLNVSLLSRPKSLS